MLVLCFCALALVLPKSQAPAPTAVVVQSPTPVVGIAHSSTEYVNKFEIYYGFYDWKQRNDGMIMATSKDGTGLLRISVRGDEDVWKVNYLFPKGTDKEVEKKNLDIAFDLLRYAVPDGEAKDWIVTAVTREEYIVRHRNLEIYFTTNYFGEPGLIMRIEEM